MLNETFSVIFKHRGLVVLVLDALSALTYEPIGFPVMLAAWRQRVTWVLSICANNQELVGEEKKIETHFSFSYSELFFLLSFEEDGRKRRNSTLEKMPVAVRQEKQKNRRRASRE